MRVLILLGAILCVCLVAGKRGGKRKIKAAKVNKLKMMQQRLDDLTEKVKVMSSPVHVHLHGGGASRGDAPSAERPCSGPEVRCVRDPCDGATCAAFPNAVCRANYCGGCNAEFWAGGMEVTQRCDADQGTNIHVHLSLSGEGGVAGRDGGVAHMHASAHKDPAYAVCTFGSNFPVQGYIRMTQKHPGVVQLQISLTGLPPRSTHGFHLHEFGDMSKGCSTFGGHYNPHGAEHGGGHHHDGHAGDWANVVSDGEGGVQETRTVSADLRGDMSVLGRGVVVHGQADDHVSGGSAGGRVACCVVAAAAGHE